MLSKQEMWEKLGSTFGAAERTGSSLPVMFLCFKLLFPNLFLTGSRRHPVWEMNGGVNNSKSLKLVHSRRSWKGGGGLCPRGPLRDDGGFIEDLVLTCHGDGSI